MFPLCIKRLHTRGGGIIGGRGWGAEKLKRNMASGLSGLQTGLAVVKPLQSKTSITTSATTTTLGGIQSGNGGYCMLNIHWKYL